METSETVEQAPPGSGPPMMMVEGDDELRVLAVHLSRMSDAHVDGIGPLTGVLTLEHWESFDVLLEGVKTRYKQNSKKTIILPWHRIECLEVK